MDIFLGKVTQQAMNYAIRSGITITASYAIKQTSKLLKTAEGDERDELQDLQLRLESKIKIISPAIDMIELISARGNTSLESAVTLTKHLRYEIQSLGQRLAQAAETEEQLQSRKGNMQDKAFHSLELKKISQAIRKLLNRIEDAVPLISLAIAASGANLSSSLPSTVSPSRLLQASTFLTAGDSQYGTLGTSSVQIGPIFTLSMYMLFQGHMRPQNEEDVRETIWKEVVHKADVRLIRTPIQALHRLMDDTDNEQYLDQVRPDEYAYQIRIIEDLEDDRVHTFEEDEPQPQPFGDIPLAGIREAVPIHQISKIFYADTGKILNIGTDGETNNPILLLKRDVNARPPRRMTDELEADAYGNDTQKLLENQDFKTGNHASSPVGQRGQDSPNLWRLPPGLDPEWIAFEVYTEAEDSDTETEPDIDSPSQRQTSRSVSSQPKVTAAMSRLNVDRTGSASCVPSTPTARTPSQQSTPLSQDRPHHSAPALPPIRTSLSLLEMLLRLLSLQQFQQQPHLSIPDELLTFFLSEAASTGAASSDTQERKRLREEAKRRVGFDPYDESPIKRHGEEYQRGEFAEWQDQSVDMEGGYSSPFKRDDEGYGTAEWGPLPGGSRRSQSGTPKTPSTGRQSGGASPITSERRSNGRPPPATRWTERMRNGAEKKGSPLSRPATGRSDEGLGTSPLSPREGADGA